MTTQEIQPFQPISQVSTPVKLGKFKASKMIIKQSWALLKQDKEMMWFPVLSAITSLLALTVIGILYYVIVLGGDINAFNESHPIDSTFDGQKNNIYTLYYTIVAIAYYTVMFFIVNFFQAGIYIIANGRMNGSNLTFGDGLRGASEVAGKIFVWSLISATVGVVLDVIAKRFKLIGTIVASVFGAAWNILTYFSLPSLVIGKVSVIESFKMSADTIRKTWGETIIINVGAGLFFTLIFFAVFALGIGTMILVPTTLVVISVVCLLVLFTIGFSIISSVLGSIFKLALYEYAQTGKVPQGFSPELIQGAITAK